MRAGLTRLNLAKVRRCSKWAQERAITQPFSLTSSVANGKVHAYEIGNEVSNSCGSARCGWACRRSNLRIPCSVGQVPCSGKKVPCFRRNGNLGCKPLNPLGDRFPKPPQEAGIGRDFQKFRVNFPALGEWRTSGVADKLPTPRPAIEISCCRFWSLFRESERAENPRPSPRPACGERRRSH